MIQLPLDLDLEKAMKLDGQTVVWGVARYPWPAAVDVFDVRQRTSVALDHC